MPGIEELFGSIKGLQSEAAKNRLLTLTIQLTGMSFREKKSAKEIVKRCADVHKELTDLCLK